MRGRSTRGRRRPWTTPILYHTEHWRSAASYVALTRQRESAQVFAARETVREAAQLARQMARGEVKAASVAWATRDELTVEPGRARELRGPQAACPDAAQCRAALPAE
jgi:hypothetical protein